MLYVWHRIAGLHAGTYSVSNDYDAFEPAERLKVGRNFRQHLSKP